MSTKNRVVGVCVAYDAAAAVENPDIIQVCREMAIDTMRALAAKKGRVVVDETIRRTTRKSPSHDAVRLGFRAETAPKPDWKRKR